MSGEPEDYPLKALAKRLRRPVDSLLAQVDSTDPYTVDMPYRCVPAEWFAGLYHELKVKPGSHVRRIFYLLVSQPKPILLPSGKPFQNTDRCWTDLCNAARDARYLGLIPANTIVDQRNPDPVLNLSGIEDSPAEITVIDGSVERSGDVSHCYNGPRFTLPSLSLDGPVVAQRYHVEIWAEKSTMNDILLPLGRQYGVNVVTAVGEMSATACEDLVDRARSSGRPVRILYVSDFDPAGRSMPLAAARKMEFWARGSDPEAEIDIDFQVLPVVLTPEQCLQYMLPRTPIKKSDRRAAAFEKRFGAGATELDALEALHPGELRQILLGHIRRYYDSALSHNVALAVSDAEDDLDQRGADVRDQYTDQIKALEDERAAIRRDGRAALSAAWVQIEEQEKAFEDRARPVLEAMTKELEANAPDADEFDWPEPAEGEEHEDPMFDSTRSYVDQVARYHIHQGKDTEVALWQDRKIVCVCARCGKNFPASASRTQAKVCSPACRLAMKRSRRKAKLAALGSGGHKPCTEVGEDSIGTVNPAPNAV
jgi:hypothetical protein